MENTFLDEMKKVVYDLEESQLKVEKHAFDVINSSDTSLNLVKEGISSVGNIIEQINKLNEVLTMKRCLIVKLDSHCAKICDDIKLWLEHCVFCHVCVVLICSFSVLARCCKKSNA